MRPSRFSGFFVAIAMLLAIGVVAAQQGAPALAGQWQGAYVPKSAGGPGKTRSHELGSTRGATKVPVTITITAADDGTLSGTWLSTFPKEATPLEIAVDGDTIRFTVPATKASWEGKLSADGSKLDGTWQGKGFGGDQEAPLVLRRSGS